jgi:hypothetical protein
MGEEKSIVLLSLGLHPAAAPNTKPLYRIFPFPLSCLFSQIVLAFPSSQTFPISPKPQRDGTVRMSGRAAWEVMRSVH